jgi:hypothetical protein
MVLQVTVMVPYLFPGTETGPIDDALDGVLHVIQWCYSGVAIMLQL